MREPVIVTFIGGPLNLTQRSVESLGEKTPVPVCRVDGGYDTHIYRLAMAPLPEAPGRIMSVDNFRFVWDNGYVPIYFYVGPEKEEP